MRETGFEKTMACRPFGRILALVAIGLLAGGASGPVQADFVIQTVLQGALADDQQIGEYLSAAMDKQGRLHVVFCDFRTKTLKYIRRVNGAWSAPAVVDPSPTVGGTPSIAVDSQDRPHLVYRDALNDAIKYAYLEDGRWNLDVVDEGGYIGARASLALDAGDRPHIAYDSHGNLKYARRDAGAWTKAVVDAGYNSAIALDRAGRPHIAYARWGTLKYALLDSRGWARHKVFITQEDIHDLHLVMDSRGRPHIASLDDRNRIRYSGLAGEDWTTDLVHASNHGTSDMSLRLDGRGRPHIAFDESGPGAASRLHYAVFDGQAWDISVAHSASLIVHNALALDSRGKPHLVYLNVAAKKYQVQSAEWKDEEAVTKLSGEIPAAGATDKRF